MVKLVDMPDLGSGAARRVGSSPITRTEKALAKVGAFLFVYKQPLKKPLDTSSDFFLTNYKLILLLFFLIGLYRYYLLFLLNTFQFQD